MHTLTKNTIYEGKWDVIFRGQSVNYIHKALEFDEALKWVNYLNGGHGNPINSSFVISGNVHTESGF